MGVDLDSGASQIAQLLQPEQSQPEKVAQPSDSAQEPETAEQSETVEDSFGESEHQEAEQDYEDSLETPEGDTEAEPTYTVRPDGVETEVSLEDLKKGYMMESDYRKKTSEVARMREDISNEREEFGKKISAFEQDLLLEAEDLNSAENLDLKEYDPAAYYKKRDALEEKAKRLAGMREESQKALVQKNQVRIEKEKELLFRAIPEWLDKKTMNEEITIVNDYLSGMGFEGESLQPFIDHRLLVMAKKAAMFDRIKSAKPEAKKVQPKPKSAKAGTLKTKQEKSRSRSQDVRNKAKKTGRMKDAQAAIKSILRG